MNRSILLLPGTKVYEPTSTREDAPRCKERAEAEDAFLPSRLRPCEWEPWAPGCPEAEKMAGKGRVTMPLTVTAPGGFTWPPWLGGKEAAALRSNYRRRGAQM